LKKINQNFVRNFEKNHWKILKKKKPENSGSEKIFKN
jgi:hypothetical protein